jgi:hyperosmotically inducible protein
MRKNATMLVGLLLGVGILIGCAQSDTGITTSVKARLATDDTVKAYQIDVDTKERVVSLSGTVETAAAKDQAVKIAHDTDGVVSVVDNLVVNPTATTGERARQLGGEIRDSAERAGESARDVAEEAGRRTGEAANRTGEAIGDAGITAAVKAKFLTDLNVRGLKIDVDTKDNVVTLSGTVSSETERNQALKLARETDRVTRVVDRLTVKP